MIFVVVVFREYARFDKIFDKESEYVLNTNSMKIHIAGCVSERKMSDKNRKTVKAKVLDLVGDGYTICFNCYAGLKRRNVVETVLDNTLFKNITAEKQKDLPTVEEYLKAVDTMCEWYTNHIPTYLTELEQESLKDYESLKPYIINNKYKGEYLKEYILNNRYKSGNETEKVYQVLGFKIYDSIGFSKDINGDGIVDLTIDNLLNNFELQKGDIIARPGHVHFYLGDGKALSVENFGWGKVNRCFPQISNIYIENNRIKFVNIITGKAEYYTRVYHYAGTRKE